MSEENTWDDASPFDHAVAWNVGTSGYNVSEISYNECVAHVIEQTGCTLEEAQRATGMAIKACGRAPHRFTPPFYPNFKASDIAVGDTVYGGRTVYDEHVMMHGVVTKIEKWYAGGKPMYSIYIHGKFSGYEGEEDISLDSIYKVEKLVESEDDEEDFSCHYCGMPAVGFDFFDAPVCRECGGK